MTSPNNIFEKTQSIKDKAHEAGFETVGICDANTNPTLATYLKRFLDNNHHGSMTWMENRAEQRASPQHLWPDARSVIMLGMNYGPDINPLTALEKKSQGTISVYAQNKDYHDIVKKRLKQIARWLVETYKGDVKVFVDTAPVMEKPLGQKAGLGWQGKHTNLVSRDYGSWLFLGAIYTTHTLAYDKTEIDHCGNCQSCLDVCPTNAFPAPYQLDAKRCISYLTIEHKGSIPLEFRKNIGNRIYGCDDCLAVCPWNKFAQHTQQNAFHARKDLQSPTLKSLLALDDSNFRMFFSGSPIKRIGRNRFIRNVLIAAGNSNDQTLNDNIRPHLSDEDAVIQETAAWALSQLSDE